VIEVFKNLQALLNDGVAFVALDVRHKSNTARVVLVGTGVQTVFFKMLDFSSRGHGNSSSVGTRATSQRSTLLRQGFK